MKHLIFTVRRWLPWFALLLAGTQLRAQELQPFDVSYEARYGNLEASAVRSLSADAATQQWRLASMMRLQLFGTTVVEIEETSLFGWQDQLPLPAHYGFHQRGLGSRSRSLTFTADRQVHFDNDGKAGTLSVDEPAYDDLNSFLVLREQLRQGATDITFTVVDRDELKPYRYQVKGEETLQTPVGNFRTLHLSRIREAGNTRTTDLWLAPQYDYVLLKLVQDEPDGETITLELERGTVNGQPLQGDQPEMMP